MNKLGTILFVLWMVLAIAAFIGAFWVTSPIVRTLGIIFGVMNLTIIMSWISASIKAMKEGKEKESD